MNRRAAPHRGLDVHYGDAGQSGDDGQGPSKTQLKQQSADLQALGQALAELPADRLAAIEMPEALRDAMGEWRRTRSHEGRRRQMQFIGKLMRQADAGALHEALAAATVGSARETLLLHQTESWRRQLLTDEAALTRWAEAFPQSDLQQLRSLVRAARRDEAGTPGQRQPRSWRDLFQYIRPYLQS
ncbi:MAG TPA: ribosome biogenesis factor YjgA [Rubrivivax sp.]|nr:ribosome biogenesis factor YjgA [Rubrivivax sp.]